MKTESLFKYLYAFIALTYISGLFIPLMENDSAQQAVMSMRVYLTDNFFDLQRGNEPYLDKPHMHFWLAALSYKLFGLTEWAYRIPSLLFTLLGSISVFFLARDLYKKYTIAHISALIFLTSQTIFLANHDVRTDAVLTGATIFAIWQLFRYINTQKTTSIILGAIGLGISFSTKGLYGPMIVFFAIISQMIFMKKVKILWSYKTIIGLIVFLITITPVVYAYYVQFGEQGVEFILWKQSFERATATNLIPTNTDYFFFFHSLLWLFFPWSLLMYYGLLKILKKWIQHKFRPIKLIEVLTIAGVFTTLFVMSFSQFKLPHHINPLIPLLSILTAHFIFNWHEKEKQTILKVFLIIDYVLILILIPAIIVLLFFVFEPKANFGVILAVLFTIILIGFGIIHVKNNPYIKLVVISVLMMVFLNTALNLYFYPKLLQYQAGIQLSRIITEKNIDTEKIFMFDKGYSWTLDFYTQRNTPEISIKEIQNSTKDTWIFVDKNEHFKRIKESGVQIIDSIKVDHFRVSKLNMKFMRPESRASKLKKARLIRIKN